MLECDEIPRVRAHGKEDVVREIMRREEPVIIEEGESEVVQRLAREWSDERLAEVLGDRDVGVRYFERGEFDMNVPFALQTARVPAREFLDGLRDPGDRARYYMRITSAFEDQAQLGKELFDDLGALSDDLTVCQCAGRALDTIWIGGANNVTPIHYDDPARFHGVIRGHKQFVMWRPNYSHYRHLDTYSLRSPAGWYSRIGLGPLDTAVHPGLAKTKPVKAVVGPGEFLYMPSCWWHHVSIPSELTISVSVTYRPASMYRRWYFWRLRLARLIGGQEKLYRKVKGALPGERKAVGQ